MAGEKSSYPPVGIPRSKGNILALMAAIAQAEGQDYLEAARCYNGAKDVMKFTAIPDFKGMAEKLATQSEDNLKGALATFQMFQREVNTLCTNLRRACSNLERGLRWQHGLHKRTSADPLYTTV